MPVLNLLGWPESISLEEWLKSTWLIAASLNETTTTTLDRVSKVKREWIIITKRQEEEGTLSSSSSMALKRMIAGFVEKFATNAVVESWKSLRNDVVVVKEDGVIAQCLVKTAKTMQTAREMARVVDLWLGFNDGSVESNVVRNVQIALLHNDDGNNNGERNGTWDRFVEYFQRDVEQCCFDEKKEIMELDPPRSVVMDAIEMFGWRPALDSLFAQVGYDAVKRYVGDVCSSSFEEEHLDRVLAWTTRLVETWLRPLSFEDQRWRLDFFAHDTLGKSLSSNLFEMIPSFPECTPALVDLRRCLDRTRGAKELATLLREEISRRLLHSGVATNSIIIYYVKMIKALDEVDPTEGILNVVAVPIKSYLRSRSETVRCVVRALTNDGTNMELHAELGLDADVNPIELDVEHSKILSEDDDDHEENDDHDKNYNIERVLPQHSKRDALGTLVRIYGTKEVFVEEYKNFLAERLLRTKDFDVAREVRSLEMLKVRFGEATMRDCTIMLNDVEESRRVNALIKRETSNSLVDAVLVSRHFWPRSVLSDGVKLHSSLRRPLKKFSRAFAELKKPKRLIWRPLVGFVDLDVRVGNESREYKDVPMVQANFLSLVAASGSTTTTTQHEAGGISAEDLAHASGSSIEHVRKRMSFWVHEGVVIVDHSNGKYLPAASLPVRSSNVVVVGGTSHNNGEEDDNAAAGNDDDHEYMDDEFEEDEEEEEESTAATTMEVENDDNGLAQFVTNMLSASGPLTLETIHRNMLLFGAAFGNGGKTEAQLEEFLDGMVGRGEVEQRGGAYVVVE